MAAILLTLAQGMTTGAAGESIIGATGSLVTVGNDSAFSGQYKLEDVPAGSALSEGNLGGVGTTATFTPDVRGSYLVGLYDGAVLKAQLTFIVPELDGSYLPPYGATGDTADPTTGAVTKGNYRPTGALTKGWKGLTTLLRSVAAQPVYVPPPKSGWSWDNQGTATVDETGPSIVLLTPAENHYNLRVRKRAFAANKRVVAAFSAESNLNTVSSGFPEVAVGWTDGTKLITISTVLVATAGWYLEVHKFNTWTSHDTNVLVRQHPAPHNTWIKLHDDGADRIAYISPDDGKTWAEIYREARTTFLTATHHVFLAGAGGGLKTTGVLRSWAED